MAQTLTEAVVTEMLRIVSHPLEKIKRDPALKLEFAQVHRLYTGNKLCCDEAIDQSYYWMQTVIDQYQKKKMKQQPKSNYKLTEDFSLYVPEIHMHVSNVNLTDDLAKLILSHHPKWAKHFEVIPPGGMPEPLTEKEKSPGTDKAAIAAAQKNAEEKQADLDAKAKQHQAEGEAAAEQAAAEAAQGSGETPAAGTQDPAPGAKPAAAKKSLINKPSKKAGK